MSHLLAYLVVHSFPFDEVAIDSLFSPSVNFCPSVLSPSLVASAFPSSSNPMCSDENCLNPACDEDSFSATHLELTEPPVCRLRSAFQLREIYLLKWLLLSFSFSACWLSWLDLPVFLYLLPLYFHLYVLLLWGLRYFFCLISQATHIWISRAIIFSSN